MQGWGGSYRGGGGVCHVGVGWGGVGHCKGKHEYKMHIYHDHKKLKIIHTATTRQGSRNIKGADLCLAYDMGVEALGPPFGRHAALWLFHLN